MNRRLLPSSPAVGAGSRTTSPVAVSRPARRLIGVMLVVAAALDLTRCGLVMVASRHPAPAGGLVAVGPAAAGCSRGRTSPAVSRVASDHVIRCSSKIL